jgi:cytochrome c peroxidase
MKWKIIALLFVVTSVIISCRKDGKINLNLFSTTAYQFNIPSGTLPTTTPKPIPLDNATTNEGVALGRMLFYDPILSGNGTQSCASCHLQSRAFTDAERYSRGIDGSIGNRNAMPLFNLMWNPTFFWDGRDSSLEQQALHPIENPIEMKAKLEDVITKLNNHPSYPDLFNKAFGSKVITKQNLAKAIAQFERTIISCNSRYDKIEANPFDKDTFTTAELRGKLIFEGNNPSTDGDCIHCHTAGTTFSDYGFKNNGLNEIPLDSGRYYVTKKLSDIGKFKTPSLRNIALTAPYMHDGRFNTLEEVMDHYNTGFHATSQYLDPVMQVQVQGRLTKTQRNDVIAFLNTLTDSTLITNPAYSKP